MLIVLATVAALTPLSLAAACLHFFSPHAIRHLNGVLTIMVATAAAGFVVALFSMIARRA